MIPNTVALEEYLAPLAPYLDDASVSEILINRPNSIFIERRGVFSEHVSDLLDMRHLMGLSNLIARYSAQRLSEREPLLSGQLPSGHRIQVILNPATAQDRIVISVRKQTIENMTLDDCQTLGMFANTRSSQSTSHRQENFPRTENKNLHDLFQHKKWMEFLNEAVMLKKNILISGATSTGKTTLLNACLKSIPLHEHIVTLEDVSELRLTHRLHTPLFASKGLQGTANITMQDLVQAALRIRPDRIVMGELRGAEAADFIHATATGHDGSISSLHASSPQIAFMRLVHMVKLNGTNLSREDILEDLHSVVDVVVQLRRRMENNHHIREVSEIYYAGANI